MNKPIKCYKHNGKPTPEYLNWCRAIVKDKTKPKLFDPPNYDLMEAERAIAEHEGKVKQEKKYWTIRELNLLREVFNDSTKDQLLELFPNRSINAIRDKAAAIGVSDKKPIKSRLAKNKKWTDADIAVLADNLATTPSNLERVYRQMTYRTREEIRKKMVELRDEKGIAVVGGWTKEEDFTVKQMTRATKANIEAIKHLLPNRTRSAIKVRFNKLKKAMK